MERKVLTITDKFRTVEKILSCTTLEDFLSQGKDEKYLYRFPGKLYLFSVFREKNDLIIFLPSFLYLLSISFHYINIFQLKVSILTQKDQTRKLKSINVFCYVYC